MHLLSDPKINILKTVRMKSEKITKYFNCQNHLHKKYKENCENLSLQKGVCEQLKRVEKERAFENHKRIEFSAILDVIQEQILQVVNATRTEEDPPSFQDNLFLSEEQQGKNRTTEWHVDHPSHHGILPVFWQSVYHLIEGK